MEKFINDIIYTPIVPTKVKFEVVDPVGIITETHEFEYKAAYYAGRAILTVGDHHWMITGNGRKIYRIGPDPEEESQTKKPTFIDKARKWLELRQSAQREKHEHVFDSDGGSCLICRKTVADLFEEPEKNAKL